MTRIDALVRCFEVIGFNDEEIAPFKKQAIALVGESLEEADPKVEDALNTIFSHKTNKVMALGIIIGFFYEACDAVDRFKKNVVNN